MDDNDKMDTSADGDFNQPPWIRARYLPLSPDEHADLLPDLFRGSSQLETVSVDGMNLACLSVLLPGEATVPSTPAVQAGLMFEQGNDHAHLPFNMQWKQTSAGRFELAFDMPAGMRCLGLGEHFSGLNLRGAVHWMISTDNPHHNESADALYKVIPFLILQQGANYTGIFLDSAAPQRWDLDSQLHERAVISLFTRRGWRLWAAGPAPLADIVRVFTALTGRCHQPPRWSLGHFQCRWSYPDEQTVRRIAQEFRSRNIPCDSIVLDIDYMDEYRVFTLARERFSDFGLLCRELKEKHFSLMTIVDPGIKQDAEFDIFQKALQRNLLCKKVDGTPFTETVWAGVSVFPDFCKAETRQWWAQKLSFYTSFGVNGIWNDMNEPAFFGSAKPLPADFTEMPTREEQPFFHETDDGEVGHLEVRNLYGLEMCRATFEGLLEHQPSERPFVLTRSAYAGIQRYAAVWLGDNMSWFEHLRKAIPMLLNTGLSGCAFCGVDIGGFGGDTSAELLIRWYEQGIFYPFFRNHSAMASRAQEPWAFGPSVEMKIKHLIETRYKLLPYIETLFHEHRQTGAPLMRPLSWHYPADAVATGIDDQFLFGPSILVAPALDRGITHRFTYFPEGLWHPFEGGTPIRGPVCKSVAVMPGTVPAFVRDAAIIPFADNIQSTKQYPDAAISFVAYGPEASGCFYEDDGATFSYLNGDYNFWRLTLNQGEFRVERVHNGYKRATRQYRWAQHGQSSSALKLKA